jgi:hypothetical protein
MTAVRFPRMVLLYQHSISKSRAESPAFSHRLHLHIIIHHIVCENRPASAICRSSRRFTRLIKDTLEPRKNTVFDLARGYVRSSPPKPHLYPDMLKLLWRRASPSDIIGNLNVLREWLLLYQVIGPRSTPPASAWDLVTFTHPFFLIPGSKKRRIFFMCTRSTDLPPHPVGSNEKSVPVVPDPFLGRFTPCLRNLYVNNVQFQSQVIFFTQPELRSPEKD